MADILGSNLSLFVFYFRFSGNNWIAMGDGIMASLDEEGCVAEWDGSARPIAHDKIWSDKH